MIKKKSVIKIIDFSSLNTTPLIIIYKLTLSSNPHPIILLHLIILTRGNLTFRTILGLSQILFAHLDLLQFADDLFSL